MEAATAPCTGDTNGFPYVFRIMLRMTRKRLVHQNWMFDAAKEVSTGIENARTRATCPDIYSADIFRHQRTFGVASSTAPCVLSDAQRTQ